MYQSISDLKGTTLGISRHGRLAVCCFDMCATDPSHPTISGSQTMAYVMALQQKWPTEALKFQGLAETTDLLDTEADFLR